MSREVWVVDDDRGRLDATLSLLRERGIATRGFSEPQRVVERCTADPPAVILTELSMRGSTGVELARALRERLTSACPRILLVTASPVRRAELTLFDHVVHKPFQFDALLPRIQAYLAPRTAARSSHVRLSAERGPTDDTRRIVRQSGALPRVSATAPRKVGGERE